MTLGIEANFATLSINDIQHKQHSASQLCTIMPSAIMISVIVVSVIMMSVIIVSDIMLHLIFNVLL